MNLLKRLWVWLSRIHLCRGFGIQSPTDYWFVRYVINEHWPYYAYAGLGGRGGGWLTHKVGRLCLRLANWRQPALIVTSRQPQQSGSVLHDYFRAGCRTAGFAEEPAGDVELAYITAADAEAWQRLLPHCTERSVVVVGDLWRNWPFWRAIEQHDRVGTTFDLYYCGIVFFDTKRFKHHYKVNF